MVTYSGKVVYQDLLEPKTLPLKKNTTVEIGDLISLDGNGYLIQPARTAANPTVFPRGVFQALSGGEIGNAASDSDGDVKIQVALVRSRIAIPVEAGVRVGDKVVTSNNSVKKVKSAPASPADHTIIGTVVEFDEAPGKFVGAADDIAVVDFGLGVN